MEAGGLGLSPRWRRIPVPGRFWMYLEWLPTHEDWDGLLRSVKDLPIATAAARLGELANSRMEFAQVVRLDRTLQRVLKPSDGELAGSERVRLALLGSATTGHLVAGIR